MKKDNGRQGWGISGTNVLPFDRVYSSVTPNTVGHSLKVQRTVLPAWVGTIPRYCRFQSCMRNHY